MNGGFVVVVIGVCLTSFSWCHTSSSGGCFSRESSIICYTVYNELMGQPQAAAECKQRHTAGGRLAIIGDAREQENIVKTVEGSASKLWIGAEMKFYDNWTWVDGTELDMADVDKPLRRPKYGFGRLRESSGVVAVRQELVQTSLPKASALCKLNECPPHEPPSCYFNVTAKRWHEGRNLCLAQKADLAVLYQRARQTLLNATIIMADKDYFVGLSNVKVMWQLSYRPVSDMSSHLTQAGNVEIEAKYTNWVENAPRYGNETCVVVSENGEWDVDECKAEHAFICEYRGSSVDGQESSYSSSSRGIVAGVVVLMIAVVAVSAVLYRRFKSKCRSENEFDRLMVSGGGIEGRPTGNAYTPLTPHYRQSSTDSPDTSEIPDLNVLNGAPYATIASADEAPTSGATHGGYQPVVLYASLEPKQDDYVSMKKVVK